MPIELRKDAETKVSGSLDLCAEDFRSACAAFPSGVTVVTRTWPDGSPYGMTVGSFASVSLEPPLFLICVAQTAGFVKGLNADMPYVVNVLSEEQHVLAQRFASHAESQRFAGVSWTRGWQGVPVLDRTAAALYCSVESILLGGDHVILISRVHGVERSTRRALVWCEHRYYSLVNATTAPTIYSSSETG